MLLQPFLSQVSVRNEGGDGSSLPQFSRLEKCDFMDYLLAQVTHHSG